VYANDLMILVMLAVAIAIIAVPALTRRRGDPPEREKDSPDPREGTLQIIEQLEQNIAQLEERLAALPDDELEGAFPHAPADVGAPDASDQFGSHLREHLPAITALLYIAKCDGAFRPREKRILRHFLIDDGVPNGAAGRIVDFVSTWQVPASHAFELALAELCHRPDGYRRRVVRAAAAMVASDRTAFPAEHAALEQLTRAIGPK